MVTLKITGKPLASNINNICTTNYNCAPEEVELSRDFASNPFVTIRHRRTVDGFVLTSIATDNMSMGATFLPPINGGRMPSFEESMRLAFSFDGVPREFADEAAFREAYDEAVNHNTIVFNAVVAHGKPPINGINARMNLFFEIPSDKPGVDTGGKTNYKALNKYVNVRAEQLLVRVIPPTPGTPGRTVIGNEIPQVPGRDVDLFAGEGVRINESQTEYYATIDGYIVYKGNNLSICSTIDIRNVDLSVGNIDFVGDINVSGDVQPGFIVKGKNVTVGGICQDAVLIADENVTVKIGVKGTRSDTYITAGGEVNLGYCENYTVNSKGNIVINKYAFNSNLNTGDKIMGADGKSTIAGGRIVAFAGCEFFNLGTKANTKIEVIVGRKYDAEDKLTRIQDEKARLEQSVGKIDEALNGLDLSNPKTMANLKVKKLTETKALIVKRIELFERRIRSISSDSRFENPVIEVHNEVQEGTRFKFHDVQYTVKNLLRHVKFSFDKAFGVVRYDNM